MAGVSFLGVEKLCGSTPHIGLITKLLKGDQMATYDFECELDGIFDRSYAMGDAPNAIVCPVCGDDAKRKFSVVGIEFKGRGWGSKP